MHDSSKETVTQNPELKKGKRKREKGIQRENQCVPFKATSISFSRGWNEEEGEKKHKVVTKKI